MGSTICCKATMPLVQFNPATTKNPITPGDSSPDSFEFQKHSTKKNGRWCCTRPAGRERPIVAAKAWASSTDFAKTRSKEQPPVLLAQQVFLHLAHRVAG